MLRRRIDLQQVELEHMLECSGGLVRNGCSKQVMFRTPRCGVARYWLVRMAERDKLSQACMAGFVV